MKSVVIDKKTIGDGHPCYFVAEIGTSFRNFDEAKLLINSAIEIGIDAVKIQTFEAETVTTKSNLFDMDITGKISQYELLKKIEIPKELQLQVIQYAKDVGITIFSAPSHQNDLELLHKMELPAYKIGSDLACHIPALKQLAKFSKPIILSTGMCTMNEIKDSVNAIFEEGNQQLILLHCISDYPTKPEECNLLAINSMKTAFDVPVGYSDHTIGITACFSASLLGANMIEKHFYDSRNSSGPDDIHSITKEQFKELIESTRYSEKILGNGEKKPSKSEEKNRLTNRVSIVTIQKISKGEKISVDNIDIKRPGTGLAPKHFDDILGKKAKTNLVKEQPLTWNDLE